MERSRIAPPRKPGRDCSSSTDDETRCGRSQTSTANTMSGIADLDLLLATLSPSLAPGEYAYVAVPSSDEVAALNPVCVFREEEAITVICPRKRAEEAGLRTGGLYRQITLRVHSSLQAVGLLAAVASALAAAGIPCNAVSAYYHDHLFVPEEEALRAMDVLSSLSQGARTPDSAMRALQSARRGPNQVESRKPKRA
jgi:hypothetical protein